MENIFRLEFSEKQQQFHHSYPGQGQEPNTFGWYTITEHCSNQEFLIIDAFIRSKKKDKLTLEYVLKSFSELQTFYSNLLNYDLRITKA